ncbi:MAG: hypothetical protein ACREDR_04365 [Blastocatellia bacterium]
MKRTITILTAALVTVFVITSYAGSAVPRVDTAQINVQEILRRVAAAESQNKIARYKYGYVQDFKVQTLGLGANVTGEMHRVSELNNDSNGKRIERIQFFPASTLTDIAITPDDIRNLAGVPAFLLTSEDLSKYQVDYKAGSESMS